jgi:signal transduction histidine kinase
VIRGAQAQANAARSRLVFDGGIALAVMAVLSVWLGWLVAGRALRPLRTMTRTAQEISATSLHKRLGLSGPNDEITQLGNTFDRLLTRLESAFEAQRRFVANASHELRTPLAYERSLVEIALADPNANTDTFREMSHEVLATAEQQERLIEGLLTLARSDRGLERHEPVDLTSAAAATVSSIVDDGLTVEASLDPATTTGDPRLIERLIANLVSNAITHNMPDGRVSISTGTYEGRAFLTVANTGAVVPASEIDRLFEPFERLDEDATDADGAGLGLSIVQAIANAHNATLTARPQPQGGLSIEVNFPADKLSPA